MEKFRTVECWTVAVELTEEHDLLMGASMTMDQRGWSVYEQDGMRR